MHANKWLILAGSMSLIIALIHILAIYIGAPVYAFLDAPASFAELIQTGSWIPAIITSIVTCMFLLFAIYAFAGADFMTKKPPLLILGLRCIGYLYVCRGMAAFWYIFLSLTHASNASPKEIFFSLISLCIGLCYLLGLKKIQENKSMA